MKKLQAARGNRLLIAYVTSTRPNHEIQIADDAFRLVYDHLEAGRELAQNGVDLFIHSNGGSDTVPCGFGQNANMVGLPEYGVILTGDIESPTPGTTNICLATCSG